MIALYNLAIKRESLKGSVFDTEKITYISPQSKQLIYTSSLLKKKQQCSTRNLKACHIYSRSQSFQREMCILPAFVMPNHKPE